MAAYLRPTARIAADALLPCDPALALGLAQALLVKPLMANHAHGLWGYNGETAAGLELTIQATGIGGPSAAVVLGELAGHGVRRVVRIGRCTGPEPGSRFVVDRADGEDGTSRSLGATTSRADASLTAALADYAGVPVAAVVSRDLLDEPGSGLRDRESAAVLALARRLGLRAACALVVEGPEAEEEAEEEGVETALLELGAAAARALESAREPAQTPVSETPRL